MSTSRVPHSQNSTNGRMLVIRSSFHILSWLAPHLAEKWALTLFARPQPPHRGRTPRVAGWEGRVRFCGPHHLATWEFGEGPAVLLVHGWNGGAAQMQGFIRPLIERGFRVIAFDHPGHGLSSERRVTVLDLRDAVLAVAREFGPLHGLIAHSLGATASVLALEAGLEVERAVLLAPAVEMPYFVRAFASTIGLKQDLTRGVMELIQQEVGLDPESMDLRRFVPQLHTPLLVMHDPEDREVPFSQGQSLAEAWPGARLEITKGLGHRRILSAPESIEKAVAFTDLGHDHEDGEIHGEDSEMDHYLFDRECRWQEFGENPGL